MPNSLISIRESIEELGALEERLEAALDAYSAAFADVDGQLLGLYRTKLGSPKPDFIRARPQLRDNLALDSIRWARFAFRAGITAVGKDFESRAAGMVELSDVLARAGRRRGWARCEPVLWRRRGSEFAFLMVGGLKAVIARARTGTRTEWGVLAAGGLRAESLVLGPA